MELYIDTSGKDTILVKIDGKKFETNARKEKSQKLLAFIEECLKNVGKNAKDIKNIKVNTGPGSFTGLRVGVSVANALGFTLNIPVNNKDIKKGQTIDIKYK